MAHVKKQAKHIKAPKELGSVSAFFAMLCLSQLESLFLQSRAFAKAGTYLAEQTHYQPPK